MAETDDIVARLKNLATHPAARSWVKSVAGDAATAIAERDAQIERLTRERDEAIREMSGWAAKAGETEGRLKASEWHGVIEGWKDRATTAERERDEARAEVERMDATARAEARKAALEEAAVYHDQRAEECAHHRSRLSRYSDAEEVQAWREFKTREDWHRTSATAIRALIEHESKEG